MKYKKVKLIENGFKGIEVEYHKIEKKGGRAYNNKTKDTLRFPVHLGLENKFKELRPFLLEICKVIHGDEDKSTKDFYIAETDMIGVEILDDGFVLEGEGVVFGTKSVKYKTPKIDSSDNCPNFDAIQLIIKGLIEEVDVYMEGTAKPSDEEVLIRWVERHNDKGIDIETIKGMSAEEQKETLTKLLEKAGACVMWNDEMQMDEEALSSGLDEISEKVNEEVVPWNKPVEEEEDVVDYHVLKSEAAEKEEELSTGAPEFELPKLGEELKLPVKEKVKK